MTKISSLIVKENTPLIDILNLFESASPNGLPKGLAIVVDPSEKLLGTVTDGDIRRAIITNGDMHQPAGAIMQKEPIFFAENIEFIIGTYSFPASYTNTITVTLNSGRQFIDV